MNMNMKKKTSSSSNRKKMRGFMCQSMTATAVCNVNDLRSVIVPTSTSTGSTFIINNNANNAAAAAGKYSKLLHSSNINTKQQGGGDAVDHQKPKPNPPSSSLCSSQVFQVVVMRVSIHCQGCAGKLKKHLSKMEGVTSFSIDLETKRVTVMGHISPLGVLHSISKVKKAEFWSSTATC